MQGKNSASLEFEILTYASEFCKILQDSNDLFLLSRFASTPKRQEYFQKLYEENLSKSNLILKEAKEFMPLIKEIVCKTK